MVIRIADYNAVIDVREYQIEMECDWVRPVIVTKTVTETVTSEVQQLTCAQDEIKHDGFRVLGVIEIISSRATIR